MSDMPNFAQFISRDTRQFPALVAALILLGLLLFQDKLIEPLKTWFVPSLVLYAVGACLIGCVQTMLQIRRQVVAKTPADAILGPYQFRSIVAAHIAWFLSLIAYNIYRAIL